ncbi:MAG TPA: hypothetical protein VF644_17090 [Pyrinomonadaceae bacterium]|jgi:hypothetical protein
MSLLFFEIKTKATFNLPLTETRSAVSASGLLCSLIKLKTFYLKENTFKLPDFSVAWLFFIKKRLLFDLANLPPGVGAPVLRHNNCHPQRFPAFQKF